MSSRVPVAIVGASGYTGSELLRILHGHPGMAVVSVTAKRAAGARLDSVFPHLRGVSDAVVESFDADQVSARAQVAFLALPHGEAAQVAAALHKRGVAVVDLSADFRLREVSTWQAWYGPGPSEPGGPSGPGGQAGHVGHSTHPAADLLDLAVYGLPELHRARLRQAMAQAKQHGRAPLIAVPGCYPTASVLAVAPLLSAGLVSADGLIVDAKSGVSGAGRSPGLGTHFAEIAEGLRAYKVAGTHRHTPEIEQELSGAAGKPVTLLFTPHLVPMARGILSCVYATPIGEGEPDRFRAALAAAYRDEPFVSVLAPGELPDTSHVRGSNRVHVTACYDARSRRVLAVSAIDNLVKGAAGQAVQCANLLLGFDETAGLLAAPMFP
ncbi:MAG: N-acetyl-gamma-glutamyl-phosphate reductase [Myxococcales bacterium]|nr:N-acetyl-gamma-glutamyl-phosphate reductase [Myxococcales bacterium]